jgi:Ca-activated chloride channel family protein
MADRWNLAAPDRGRWHPRDAGLAPDEAMARIRRLFRDARPLGLVFMAVLAFGFSSQQASANSETEMSPDRVQSGSLLLKMKSGYQPATRINSEIKITVSGLTVRASLRQRFRNDGNEWVEGLYVFPLPDGAAVDRMRMQVGERIIEGEVQEKRKAKAQYEKAKREGKRASLVNQQRANLFTTAVANLGPGETLTIEIEYLDTAQYDEGTFSLRFPTTLTPRYIPGRPTGDRQGSGWSPDTDRVVDASLITPPQVRTSTDHRISLHAVIDAGLPLEFVASRYHPVKIDEVGDSYDVRFAQTGVAMDHDFELIWRPTRDAAPRAMLFSELRDDAPYVLAMLVPPNDDNASTVVLPRDLVFVIDTSGSMHGVSIEQAKRALHMALDGLRPVDRFNVIQFNSITDGLFADSVPASIANVDRAKDYVDRLRANGGTEMRPALQRALRSRDAGSHLRQVIFITDGSVGNETELFSLIERDLHDARLFTVGIGSAPNGWFMRKAAEAGRGTHVTISALHEVKEKMGRLFRKLERPQVTDIVVEWPNDVEAEPYPATVPDLYSGEPVVIKARLKRAPRSGDQLRISGRSAGGDWGVELPLAVDEQSPGIASVWAREHIAGLLDSGRRGADAETIRSAVVETALRHHLVSKFTSLVAVDKTPVRPANAPLGTEQVPNLLAHGQSQRAIFGFPATATDAGSYRRNGSVCLLLATLLLLRRVWTIGGPRHAPA